MLNICQRNTQGDVVHLSVFLKNVLQNTAQCDYGSSAFFIFFFLFRFDNFLKLFLFYIFNISLNEFGNVEKIQVFTEVKLHIAEIVHK